jgi:hypothetical protein
METKDFVVDGHEVSVELPGTNEDSILQEADQLIIDVGNLSMKFNINDLSELSGWSGNGRVVELAVSGSSTNDGLLLRHLLPDSGGMVGGGGRLTQLVFDNGMTMALSDTGGPVIIGNGRLVELELDNFTINLQAEGTEVGNGRIALLIRPVTQEA